MRDEVLEAVAAAAADRRRAGLSMAQLALAWVLRRDEVASAIVGASRPEQVHANAAASGVELDRATARGRSTRRSAGVAIDREPRLAGFAERGRQAPLSGPAPRAPAVGPDIGTHLIRLEPGRQRVERDRGEVGRGGGDHEHVEDLVVAEDRRAAGPGAGARRRSRR